MTKTLIKNTAILTGTSLILRAVGVVFRIWISERIGAAGIGLYQLVFSVYVLASTFAASGISTAVTRLIADEAACGTRRSVSHIMHRAMAIGAVAGVLSAVAVSLAAGPIAAGWIREAGAAPSLRIAAISLPFMGIAACLRGYFLARGRAGIPSGGLLLEQAVRIGVTLPLIRLAGADAIRACAYIMAADTLAQAVAAGYLWVRYRADRRRLPIKRLGGYTPPTGVVRRIGAIALPITTGQYLSSGLRTVENMMVPACLAVFLGSSAEGLRQFGLLKGMALPLLFFPASLLNAITALMIPTVSHANTLGRQDRIAEVTVRTVTLTLIGSILAGGLFTLLADEIATMIYHSHEVAALLRVLAPLMPVMYLESMVSGLLKGLNRQNDLLKISVADSALRILLIALLVPRGGMPGFLLIMIVSNYLTGLWSLRCLLSATKVRIPWIPCLIKPLAAMIAVGAVIVLLRRLPLFAALPAWGAAGLFGTLAVGGYLLLLRLEKAI